jgi:hypothetical protein
MKLPKMASMPCKRASFPTKPTLFARNSPPASTRALDCRNRQPVLWCVQCMDESSSNASLTICRFIFGQCLQGQGLAVGTSPPALCALHGAPLSMLLSRGEALLRQSPGRTWCCTGILARSRRCCRWGRRVVVVVGGAEAPAAHPLSLYHSRRLALIPISHRTVFFKCNNHFFVHH